VTTRGGNAVIVVHDKGDMAMPIILRAEYADGTSVTVTRLAEPWFTGTRSQSITVPLRGKTLKSVSIDPENRFQDIDPANNVWSNKALKAFE
jgi:hypothetical protein